MNRGIVTAKLVVPSAGRGQDRAEVFETDDGVVIVVADGAGGTGGGAEAAESAVDAVRKAVVTLARGPRFAVPLLRDVDQNLAAQGIGETTAVIAIVTASGIVGASVGDSGAWLVRSHDHVDLTSGQVRKPLVGSGAARPVRFQYGDLDGTLLVASDGLFKYAKPRDICAEARGPDLAYVLDALARLLRLPAGGLQDDVAIVVCRAAP